MASRILHFRFYFILEIPFVGDRRILLQDEVPTDVVGLKEDPDIPAIPDLALVVEAGARDPGTRGGAYALAVDEGDRCLHHLNNNNKNKIRGLVMKNINKQCKPINVITV